MEEERRDGDIARKANTASVGTGKKCNVCKRKRAAGASQSPEVGFWSLMSFVDAAKTKIETHPMRGVTDWLAAKGRWFDAVQRIAPRAPLPCLVPSPTLDEWDVQSRPCELPIGRLELRDARAGGTWDRSREELLLASPQDRSGTGEQNLIILIVEKAQRGKKKKKKTATTNSLCPPLLPHFQHNPIERLLDPVMIYKVTSQTDLL